MIQYCDRDNFLVKAVSEYPPLGLSVSLGTDPDVVCMLPEIWDDFDEHECVADRDCHGRRDGDRGPLGTSTALAAPVEVHHCTDARAQEEFWWSILLVSGCQPHRSSTTDK